MLVTEFVAHKKYFILCYGFSLAYMIIRSTRLDIVRYTDDPDSNPGLDTFSYSWCMPFKQIKNINISELAPFIKFLFIKTNSSLIIFVLFDFKICNLQTKQIHQKRKLQQKYLITTTNLSQGKH